MRRLRVLVADDHPLMVEAIRIALSVSDEFEIVGATDSGRDVVELAERLELDVILLDLRLPGKDGLEVLHELEQSELDVRVIVLSACEEPEVVNLAFDAGACAFIMKRIDPHDLAAALRQALDRTLFQPLDANPLVTSNGASDQALTERELVVLRAVAEGLSNREIAKRLAYAEQTVKLDLTHIYRKLGVSSRTEAMVAAYKRGLIEPRLVELAPTT